jgi:membrane-bound lytic murein transglycosylase D
MEGTGGVTTVTSRELATLHEKAIEDNNAAITSGFGDNNALRAKLSSAAIEGTTIQKIQGKYNSMILANTLGYDIAQFNKLNPGFDKLVSEEAGYELRLPDEKMQQFLNNRYQILQQSIMASLQSVTETPEGFPEPKKAGTPATSVKKKK